VVDVLWDASSRGTALTGVRRRWVYALVWIAPQPINDGIRLGPGARPAGAPGPSTGTRPRTALPSEIRRAPGRVRPPSG
jgi:hypothetical protein